MNNNIIIAITQTHTDNINILPPVYDFSQTDGALDCIAIFHSNPRVESTADRGNFDYHLDFNTTKCNELHKAIYGSRYCHIPRVDKHYQYLKTISFNKTLEKTGGAPLKTPTVFTATSQPNRLAISNIGIPNCDKVVIKHAQGAKGSNQLVVPTNMLQTLLKVTRAEELTLGGIKKRFPDIIITEGSDMELGLLLDYNNFVVTEFISNIKNEWRLLVGGDKIYTRERFISAGEYPQSNLNVVTYPNTAPVTYTPLEDSNIPEDVINSIKQYVKFIGLPLGSLDLYKDNDGNFGVFEYSTQFAFHGASPSFIRQLHLDAVEYILTGIQNKE